MASFVIGAFGIGGIALAARAGLRAMQRTRGLGMTGAKKFLEGGFETEMTRKEAAQILGISESSSEEQVKAAHRSLMRLNHPDGGGSTFISTKINEAKQVILGKSR